MLRFENLYPFQTDPVLVVLYASAGVLGQTVYDNFYDVSVRYDGQEKSLATDLTTVGDLLESLGIELGPLDAVDPAPEFSIDSAIFK